MAQEPNDRLSIREYLLGLLAGDAQQEFERRLLTDDYLFEDLLVAEDELIDGYVGGHLSSADKALFEKNFLVTPERQQKLRFARAFGRYVTKAAVHERPQANPKLMSQWSGQTWMFRAATAVALVAIIAGLFWVFRARIASPPTLATLVLTPSANTRAEGAQPSKLELPLNGDALMVSLQLPEATVRAPRYRVQLENQNGQTKTFPGTERDQQTVSFVIPASQLVPGRYAVKLYAVSDDGTEQRINANYFFNAE